MKLISVVCGVVHDNDKILIAQRGDKSNYGLWEFPGGKVKPGESHYQSIIRELNEELNIMVSPKGEVAKYQSGRFNLIFIECELVTNCSAIKLTEHLDYKWVMREELLSYEFIEGDVEFVNSLVVNNL
jgi:mutator protein MutT